MQTVIELQQELRQLDELMRTLRDKKNLTSADTAKMNELCDLTDGILAQIRSQEAMGANPYITESGRATGDIHSHGGGPFRSFGEQMRAIVQAGTPGEKTDPRLFEVRSTGLEQGTPSLGGFLLQTDFSSELIGSLYRPDRLPGLVRKAVLTGAANKFSQPGFDESSRVNGSRWGGIQAYYEAEGTEKTASKPKFRKIEMSLVKLIGLCYATDELIEDVTQLGGYLREAFRAEFDFKITNSILSGTGSGQPLGVLNGGCLVTISKESGQSASTIIWDNIKKMLARFKPMNPNRAVWVTNIDCLSELLSLYQPIGTAGIPVYQPASQAAGGYNQLVGFPVIYSEAAPTVGDKMDLLLMDPTAYLLIDKAPGLQTAVSIHVRFIFDEQVFRFVYRHNGQPLFSSAITPFKGSDTVSPFVCIEART